MEELNFYNFAKNQTCHMNDGISVSYTHLDVYKRQLLVMVNPYAVKQTKELDDNSQSKNDRKDPKVIAKLVTEGRYSAPYTPVSYTHLGDKICSMKK